MAERVPMVKTRDFLVLITGQECVDGVFSYFTTTSWYDLEHTTPSWESETGWLLFMILACVIGVFAFVSIVLAFCCCWCIYCRKRKGSKGTVHPMQQSPHGIPIMPMYGHGPVSQQQQQQQQQQQHLLLQQQQQQQHLLLQQQQQPRNNLLPSIQTSAPPAITQQEAETNNEHAHKKHKKEKAKGKSKHQHSEEPNTQNDAGAPDIEQTENADEIKPNADVVEARQSPVQSVMPADMGPETDQDKTTESILAA